MAAPLLLDMVLETATNPGTASFVLNGALQDRRSFASAAPSGGQVFYFADDGTQAEWGVGTLTVGTPNSLSRQSIAGTSQNTTQPLNFTGTVRVYSWLPSAYMPRLDGNGLLGVAGLQADTLAINKTASVPAVSDWSAYQAVGAKDADARYVRMYSDSGAYAVSLLTVYPSGALGAYANGKWNDLQPAGDYATNTSLAATTTTANNALTAANTANSGVSSLASSKLNTSDGTATRLSVSYGSGSASFQGDGNFVLYKNGSSFFALSPTSITWNGQDFAFQGDLPLASARRIEAFSVSTTDGSRVNFPNGFSSADNLVINITCQRSNNRCVIASYENEDAGGFTLGMQREDTNGASQQTSPWTIHVTAIGNR